MNYRILIATLISLTGLLSVKRSNAQLYFKADNITVREGLSDNQVTSILKDRTGFMWLGTRNGLNRFDGHEFKIFRPGRQNSISNEVINDIVQDFDGNIWVATMEGLNRYDPRQGKWEHLVPDPSQYANDLPNFISWDLEIDKHNRLWIASDVFEFSVLDLATRKFKYYDWPAFASKEKAFHGASYRSIQRFVFKNEKECWLATNVGLVKLDTETGEFKFIGSGYHSDVWAIRYDSLSQKVFVSVESGNLFEYDLLKNTYRPLPVQPLPYPSVHSIKPGNNQLLIPSTSGLVEISDDRKQAFLHRHISQLPGYLLAGGVRNVYMDDTGINWVATDNGVTKIEFSPHASTFLPLLPVASTDGNNFMSSAYYDKVSDAYFVCSGEQGKVFVVDPNGGQIKTIATDITGQPFSTCNKIVNDKAGDLWLMTGKYVYRYDRKLAGFARFKLEGETGNDRNYRDMTEDVNGDYWFAAFNGGIFRYNKKEKKTVAMQEGEFNYTSKPMAVCADDHTRSIWIGTFSSGLFCYELDNGQLRYYYPSDSNHNYRGLSLIHDVRKDAKGKIWVATHSGGVYRFDEMNNQPGIFVPFTMKDGMVSNNCIALGDDGDSTLWVLTGHDLVSIKGSKPTIHPVDEKRLFNFSAYSSDERLPHTISFDTRRQRLLVAVGGGLLLVPVQPAAGLPSFPVVITRVTTGKNENRKHLANLTSLARLEFNANEIEFAYAGLGYSSFQDFSYQYKLEGYHNRWINAGDRTEAAFQNLQPAKYKFLVRTVDHEGRVSSETASFSFEVIPPFWRTWWFIVLLLAVIGYLLYRWIQSLRKKIESEKILTYFATSLYGQNTVEDIFWDVAKNCIRQLGFEDCVIYQYDADRQTLVQRAAYGPKNPNTHEILNPIEIKLGTGIVGSVGQTLVPEIVNDTSSDSRYIVDDNHRYSEISVPVVVDGKLFGVIDSEHHRKGFYKKRHLQLLVKIADICAAKISKYMIEERLRLKIARDLHDEMGSTLSSINIISKMAMQQVDEKNPLSQQLGTIKEHTSRMMDSMSDIVWAINPANDSFEKVILRMKEFAAEILEPAGINYFFYEEEGLVKTSLNLEQRKDLFMIFKEALNNAVKYSGASEMLITLKVDDRELKMVLTDNGNGFDSSQQYSGNGIRNMRARAEQMKAKLRIESIRGTGTTIFVHVPVT